MWILPFLILATTIVLAVPLGLYMAWIFDGRYRAPGWLRWVEARLNTGPQGWKQYALAFMLFNLVTLSVGYAVLSLQPYLPLNPDGKGMLSPSMIFHTAVSFMTNTNQQHYSGEVPLSYFSQIFFICWKQMISPVLGLAALLAVIRGLRGDKHLFQKGVGSPEFKDFRPLFETLRDRAEAPLGGLAGETLVNVLEVNLALRDCIGAR